MSITWSPPSDTGGAFVDKYDVQTSLNSGFNPVLYEDGGYVGNRRVDHSASPATRYYVRVRAHNSAGYGAFSVATSFVTPGGPPSAPLRLAQSSRTSDGGILGWAASSPNGASSVTYTVQLSLSTLFVTIAQTYSGLSATNVAVTGLQAGRTYYARVRATSANGTSSWGAYIAFVTLPATTYVDDGSFADHLDHLASAVADKLLHLGAYWYGVAGTNADVVPTNTITYVVMNQAMSGEHTRGPDAPTLSGLGTSQTVTINYPGTYQIDFGFAWDRGAAQGRGVQTIYVNNAWRLPADTQKRGRSFNVDLTLEGTSDTESVSSHTVHLDQGDVVGFSVYQDTGATVSSTSTAPAKVWARVTMVGF